MIGSTLKKAFNKDLKTAIANLSSAELRDYLKNESLMISNVKIEKDWLKVVKEFNSEYKEHTEFSGSCDDTSSVLLKISLDDNLKRLGKAREIINRIQKLRKSSGISFDDKIEVFYSSSDSS